MFGDSFFKKVESKTKVDKETILSLAKKLQNSNMKDENVLNELVDDISNLTGKEVSEERKKKIVEAIVNDKVPKDINNML
ncbi:MAG: stage VI sporulation protein F [Bacilli bacterium]|nr:stage VI sporulation protein F [Bacilli bacterium]